MTSVAAARLNEGDGAEFSGKALVVAFLPFGGSKSVVFK